MPIFFLDNNVILSHPIVEPPLVQLVSRLNFSYVSYLYDVVQPLIYQCHSISHFQIIPVIHQHIFSSVLRELIGQEKDGVQFTHLLLKEARPIYFSFVLNRVR